MTDIKEIKAAALAAINGYTTGNFIYPEAILELIEMLEAAERDAARLDFLSSEMNRTVHYLTGKWYWSRKPYKTYMRKESIREAIDAAMKESEK